MDAEQRRGRRGGRGERRESNDEIDWESFVRPDHKENSNKAGEEGRRREKEEYRVEGRACSLHPANFAKKRKEGECGQSRTKKGTGQKGEGRNCGGASREH